MSEVRREPVRFRRVPIFASDPDLLKGLDSRASGRLLGLEAPAFRARRGRWHQRAEANWFGYLVLNGFATREARVPGGHALEIVGPGDVILIGGENLESLVTSATHWEALSPADIAVITHQLIAEVGSDTKVVCALASRAAARADRNLNLKAIASITPVRRRLETLLWHLGDQWGIRRSGAVELPFGLTQEKLASLTGTKRETVCRELLHLVDGGVLERLPASRFRLVGRPPVERLIEQAEAELARVQSAR